MSVIEYKDGNGTLRIRGKLGRPDLPDELGIAGIYQMRPRKNGLIQVKMPFYAPTGSPGLGQLLQRQKMRELVAKWHTFTDDEKAVFKLHARTKRMTGFNWFLHLTLPTYVPVGTAGNDLLQENGGLIFQENGGKILLGDVLILLEDGFLLKTEDGNNLIV